MVDISSKLASLAIFGGLALAVINIVAAIRGFSILVSTTVDIPGMLTAPLAILAFAVLICVWLNNGLMGSAGTGIFAGYFLLSPWAWQEWGMATWASWLMALSPLLLYMGCTYLGDRLEDWERRR